MRALSVGTIADRLNPERLPTVVALLQREAAQIGPRINPFDPVLRRPSQSLAEPWTEPPAPEGGMAA